MADPRGVVTYYDFSPSTAAAAKRKLQAWTARVRSEGGADEAVLLGEINRGERFAVIETWTQAALLSTHQASGARKETVIATGMVAPPDERCGEPLSVGHAQPDEPDTLYVLIHVDVATFELNAVADWLRSIAGAARTLAGALRYDVWRQVGRPNHFTVIQAWADRDAYARHVEDAATRALRASVMSVKGALYDERLYHRLD